MYLVQNTQMLQRIQSSKNHLKNYDKLHKERIKAGVGTVMGILEMVIWLNLYSTFPI